MKKGIEKGIPFQNNASLERKYVRLVKSILNKYLIPTYEEILNITNKYQKASQRKKGEDSIITFDEKMPKTYESEIDEALSKFLKKFQNDLNKNSGIMSSFLSENLIKGSDLIFKKNTEKLVSILEESEKKGTKKKFQIGEMSKEFKSKAKKAIERNQQLRKERKVRKEKLSNDLIGENKKELNKLAETVSDRVRKEVYKSITTDMHPGTLKESFKNILGMSERQAKNAALDQTRKVYSEINRSNLTEAGVKKFEWLHISGSTQPRQLHIELSGKIFDFDDPPIIDEESGRTGYPGDEYNCRCIMIPVIDVNE